MFENIDLTQIKDMPSAEPEIPEEWRRLHYEASYNQGFVDAMKLRESAERKGKWIPEGSGFWKCNNCGYGVEPYNNTPYCPKCGADMRGEQSAMDDRPVWIFYGKSGTGKSTLAYILSQSDVSDKTIYETDSCDHLPDEIWADIIVIGNKHNYDLSTVIEHIAEKDRCKIIPVEFGR